MKRIVLDIKNYKIKLLARTLADKILNEKTRKDFGKKVCRDREVIAKDLCSKQIQCRDCKNYYQQTFQSPYCGLTPGDECEFGVLCQT